MARLKPADAKDPEDYIGQISDQGRRREIEELDRLIRREAPNLERHLLSGMLAYGTYRYRYASGREGEWAVIVLASQKRYISLYRCMVDDDRYLTEEFAERLPKADIGKSCVRFKRLADVDQAVIRELVRETAGRYADNPNFAIADAA